MNPEVKIIEDEIGSGIEANKGALVFIKYEGLLEDGTCFDSSEKHGKAFEFVVGSAKVIKGMSQLISGMRVGGKRTGHIPAELAYGDRQVGPHIKPNSNLVFRVELLEARPRE